MRFDQNQNPLRLSTASKLCLILLKQLRQNPLRLSAALFQWWPRRESNSHTRKDTRF